jgi:hypothetical protein
MKILFQLLMLSFTAGCTLGVSPDEDGEYTKQFPTTPLANQVCQVDDDCVLTSRRDGSCCDANCGQKYVFNNDTYERLQAHQGDICAEGTYGCPTAKCKTPIPRYSAKCRAGYCQVIKVPKTTKSTRAESGKQGKAAKASKRKTKRKALKYKSGKQRPGKRKVQKRP